MSARVESAIHADHKTGRVVWTMTPEVAAFYAEELRRIQGNDAGIRSDADDLNAAAVALGDGGGLVMDESVEVRSTDEDRAAAVEDTVGQPTGSGRATGTGPTAVAAPAQCEVPGCHRPATQERVQRSGDVVRVCGEIEVADG